MATAARIAGIPGSAGTFSVPSISNPGAEWLVDWIRPGLRWCACIAFTRTQDCRHAQEVEAAVRDEHDTASTPESRAAAALRLQVLAEVFDR